MMNTLRTTKVSTKVGTLFIVFAALPLVAYTFHFRAEKAKLHNGLDTSPQFIAHPAAK